MSLENRIKRQVISRMWPFFAATPPGLEKLCHDELKALPLSVQQARVIEGGVEYLGRIHDCYLANLMLRTANRILMRIGAFKATNFRQLEKKLADFAWELFLKPGAVPLIKVACRHSRLYHKKAIGDQISSHIAQRLSCQSPTNESEKPLGPEQRIYVRIVDDQFSLSIDSSGDILYKRGLKKDVGRAPLRETTAAAILKLAGYRRDEPLLDPMCGSGTFSLEAAMQAQNLPAGWFRSFAFTQWPCFRERRWQYIRRSAQQQILNATPSNIFASDQNQATCDTLRGCLERHGLDQTVHVFCKDFFEVAPGEMTDRPGLVVLNPPYGLRLGSTGQSIALFQAICRQLGQRYQKWKVALIVPPGLSPKAMPSNLSQHNISHGGLRLKLLLGRIT